MSNRGPERQHDADSDTCWCRPEVVQVCPDCEDAETPPEDCWKCAGRGLVPSFDEDAAQIIVHACDRCCELLREGGLRVLPLGLIHRFTDLPKETLDRMRTHIMDIGEDGSTTI